MKKLTLILCAVLSFFVISTANAATSYVGVWSDWYSPATINNFYNSLPDVNSTILSGTLDTVDLSGISLLWAVQPADSYSAAEISTMSNFLAGGGRIAFMGEHGNYAPDENARITAAIAALGGHISINVDYPDSGFHDATRANGQILDHPLTAGVNTYNYACFASLNISGAAQKLMLGTNLSDIMMAYENIGAGSIFVITDQNVWDNVYSSNNDNKVMFENLLLAETHPVPIPAAVWFLGSGLVGLFGLRRKFN
ncbi:MAG: hypothetical protein A4E72_00894 [Syntrophus sp. PtaU1.Bin208]|nr:MAG: hypothetical protein A4E72_00894 [Syntrophus sp. PtaU1.Bin208]